MSEYIFRTARCPTPTSLGRVRMAHFQDGRIPVPRARRRYLPESSRRSGRGDGSDQGVSVPFYHPGILSSTEVLNRSAERVDFFSRWIKTYIFSVRPMYLRSLRQVRSHRQTSKSTIRHPKREVGQKTVSPESSRSTVHLRTASPARLRSYTP